MHIPARHRKELPSHSVSSVLTAETKWDEGEPVAIIFPSKLVKLQYFESPVQSAMKSFIWKAKSKSWLQNLRLKTHCTSIHLAEARIHPDTNNACIQFQLGRTCVSKGRQGCINPSVELQYLMREKWRESLWRSDWSHVILVFSGNLHLLYHNLWSNFHQWLTRTAFSQLLEAFEVS